MPRRTSRYSRGTAEFVQPQGAMLVPSAIGGDHGRAPIPSRPRRAKSNSSRVAGARSPNPVVQEERTGCAVACVAALTGRSYVAAKQIATRLGISVDDPKLWGDVRHMRRLLGAARIRAGKSEEPFTSWERLPSRALLAIKWHREKSGPAWHWVIFARRENGSFVLDSNRRLRANRRTDFGRMRPKWFIRLDETNV